MLDKFETIIPGMDSLPHQAGWRTVSDGFIDKLMRQKTLPRKLTPQLSPQIIDSHIIQTVVFTLRM